MNWRKHILTNISRKLNNMKKQLLIINHHSFVSLITNSSSELFVCDTKKSIDAVKEILTKLLASHSELSGTQYNYDDVFGDIELSKYTFDYHSYDPVLRNEYEKYNEFGRYSSYDLPNEIEELQEEERELGKTHPYYVQLRAVQKIDPKNYKVEPNSLWADYCNKRDEIWTGFGAKKIQATGNLFVQFLKDNELFEDYCVDAEKGLCNSIQDHKKNERGQDGQIQFKTEKLNDIYQHFQQYLSYGITIKKGSIIVNSQSDNAIPYELFDLIESYLHAERHHIG